MPNRLLREGILTSDRVNALGVQAEVFYRRLMSVVDDFGRFTADPRVLRTSCYPLRVDEVREADISRWLAEVQSAGLIALYAVGPKPFLLMRDFRQLQRAKSSKFPEPPLSLFDEEQAHSACSADAPHMRSETETESRSKAKTKAGAPPAEPTASWSSEACDDWQARFGGTAPGGKIGRELKPLVTKHGWEVVRPVWRRYLAEKDAEFATPADFAQKFDVWRKGRVKPSAAADRSGGMAGLGKFAEKLERGRDGSTEVP